MKKNRCSFLFSSTDSYKDLWAPFFDLMNIYWNDIPYEVFVNTEKNDLSVLNKRGYNFNINPLNLDNQKSSDIAWSKRMIGALNKIESEYIFLVLDDFFITDFVQTDYIEQIMDIMDEDSSIASFQLSAARFNPNLKNNEVPLEYHLLEKSGWKTHFIPTIWRKSVLLKWLRPFESIWGFELYGSNRARRWNYKEKVYVVDQPFIYKYLWVEGCSAVVNGKWLDHPDIDSLFEDNNIEVDFNKRGRITVAEYRNKTMVDVLKRYKPHEIILKTINRMRSFI